ncbi:MAG: hypothetical protein ACU0DW_07575, partial [Shimia sp.]
MARPTSIRIGSTAVKPTLRAASGGGGEPVTDGAFDAAAAEPEVEALLDPFEEAVALTNELTRFDRRINPIVPSALQGTATLDGVFIAELSNIPDPLVGIATLEADFNTATLSGEVSNIGRYDEHEGCSQGFGCTATLVTSLDGDLA